MDSSFTKHEHLLFRDYPQLSERWVHELVKEDPGILNLGSELIIRDSERIQKAAGRLDLLLEDPERRRLYEIELQLGATDPSHIIRCIEYWDHERKRYRRHEHCAVLVAEDITSRFLNVVSLLNAAIPLIALKMQLIKIGSQHTLVFTKVLDELARWDDEPPAEVVVVDRNYWDGTGRKETLAFADDLLTVVTQLDPAVSLNYTKYYIGLSKDRQPFNIFSVEPRKVGVQLNLRLSRSEEVDDKIEAAGFVKTLDHAYGFYRIHVRKSDLLDKRNQLEELIELAHQEWIRSR